MTENNDIQRCELCGVECECTRHHLVPKIKAKNKYRDIRNDDSNIIMICRQCHDQLHSLWDESTLRDSYSTKEKILASEEMQKFIAWRKKHPEFDGHSKMSNSRKSKRNH